jgi:four helix bundle protein
MGEEKGYRRLRVWKKAHELVLLVYKASKNFPKEELFGLTSQMRCASVYVAANIVEGQTRGTSNEFIQFLRISNGSLVEVEYYIGLSFDLGYIDEQSQKELYEKQRIVGLLLHKFMQTIRR